VITPLLKGDEEAKDLPHASSLCGACTEACPVAIPLHDLLLKLRARQVEGGLASKAQQIAFSGFEETMKRPALYNLTGKAGRAVQKSAVGRLGKSEAAKKIPGPLGGWLKFREAPEVAQRSFRELWERGEV
jgi:L-lactate dehydrogenase complex protein LldF